MIEQEPNENSNLNWYQEFIEDLQYVAKYWLWGEDQIPTIDESGRNAEGEGGDD